MVMQRTPALAQHFIDVVNALGGENCKSWTQVARSLYNNHQYKVTKPESLKSIYEYLTKQNEDFTQKEIGTMISVFIEYRGDNIRAKKRFEELVGKTIAKRRFIGKVNQEIGKVLKQIILMFTRRKKQNIHLLRNRPERSLLTMVQAVDLKEQTDETILDIQLYAAKLEQVIFYYTKFIHLERRQIYGELRQIVTRRQMESVIYYMHYIHELRLISFNSKDQDYLLVQHPLLLKSIELNEQTPIYKALISKTDWFDKYEMYNTVDFQDNTLFKLPVEQLFQDTQQSSYKPIPKNQQIQIKQLGPKKRIKLQKEAENQFKMVRGRLMKEGDLVQRGWKTIIFRNEEDEDDPDDYISYYFEHITECIYFHIQYEILLWILQIVVNHHIFIFYILMKYVIVSLQYQYLNNMSMNSLPDSIETPNSGIFEANPSRIAKVVYPDLNISSQQVDEVQYAQMANEQLIQEVPLGVPSKKDFLTMIYRRLLIFSGSVWVFQILSLMRWFNAIMMVSYKQYWNSNYSFEQYQQWYGSSANDYDQNQLYNDYYQWKYSGYSEYYSLRWTFWVVVGLLLAQIIGTIILRNKPIMKRIQMGNYIAFTILVSFYIVGILGLSGRYLGCFFIGTNLSIIFFFVQLANIKHEFIKLTEQSLLRKTILISFILNIIFALTSSYISSITILLELLIPYPIYYFMQLNKSILEEYQVPQAQCNCLAKLKSMFTQQQVLPEQAIAIQTVRENHIVINKKHFKFGAIAVAIIGLMSLIGLHSEIFIILGIVALQMLARFVPTQIIPNDLNNKLTEQDYDLAIPLIFVDILFPIKNIRRSIKRYQ